MRKVILTIVSVVILFYSAANAQVVDNEQNLLTPKLFFPQTCGGPGERIMVPLKLDPVVPFWSIDLIIQYDPEKCDIGCVSDGDWQCWECIYPVTYSIDPENGLLSYSEDIRDPFKNVETNVLMKMCIMAKQDIACGDSLNLEIVHVKYESTEGLIDSVDTEDGSVLIGTRGDVNLDCMVNVIDVVLAVRIALQMMPEPTDCEVWAADCDRDGEIDVQDVRGIVNTIIGIGECEP